MSNLERRLEKIEASIDMAKASGCPACRGRLVVPFDIDPATGEMDPASIKCAACGAIPGPDVRLLPRDLYDAI